ncbi:MAG TPA: hypothetical protein PKC43_14835 [Phycisphaerales bacterium]|nr:hypothetical protein [Phycisphaerales bacterium]HMP38709.1 hypothetical protein [Phycisphaerales bacterium]
MASRAERTRNNVKAGIFVTVGITLAFLVVVILSDAAKIFEPRDSYVLRFPLSAGVDGLAKGSPVRVGGLQRGEVEWVRPEIDNGAIAAIRVGIELDRDIRLHADARPERVTPLLGGLGAINFADVGDPSSPVVGPGGVIDVESGSAGPLARLVGSQIARRVDAILKNIDETLAMVRADYPKYVPPALERLDGALADAQALIASVKADYGDWREPVGTTLTRIEEASGKFGPALDEGRELLANADKGVSEVRAMIAENRGSIDDIVENVRVTSADLRVIAERARAEWLDQVDRILAEGRSAVGSFETVVRRIGEEIDAVSPWIENAVADAALATQQLKLTAIEVRRAPWRLLYRPSDRELDNELLYDAARSFALAAGDLRGTAETVDRVLTRNADFLRTDPERAARLQGLLGDALDRYEQAQQRLFTILANPPAGSK